MEDGWALMTLFEQSGFALTASGRPIADVLSLSDEWGPPAHRLAVMIAGKLTPGDRSMDERLRMFAPSTRVTVEEIARFLARCACSGVAIGVQELHADPAVESRSGSQ